MSCCVWECDGVRLRVVVCDGVWCTEVCGIELCYVMMWMGVWCCVSMRVIMWWHGIVVILRAGV